MTSGGGKGGQMNADQINQAVGQLNQQNAGFTPYGNINNRIADNRQAPAMTRTMQTVGRGLEAQAQMGGGQAAMPMPSGLDPYSQANTQNLQGLLASSKANKMAFVKALAGGG